MIREEGIGSYFHLENIQETTTNTIDLSIDYNIFYTGRQALLHILNEITLSKKISKIWFPNYYCQHTLGWIKKSYPNIGVYNLNPFEFTSDKIDVTEFAATNDIVLINNYWGLSSMGVEKNTNSPIIIEDHSHGWLSDACLNSKADYCFVSLRKSLPIPLGGIYWQPNAMVSNTEYNFKKDASFYKIWERMLHAMKLKTEYMQGDVSKDPSKYLPLFYEVEEALDNYTESVCLNALHKSFINSYITLNTRKVKEENLDFVYNKIKENPFFKVLKRSGYSAFGLHLLFQEEKIYNSLKQFLVAHKIYPSSLWPDNYIEYKWRYFLNIHVDFRYKKQDMDHIAYVVDKWLKTLNP